jgi:transcriptional regulator with PAS, ATPase and Fis domain
MAHEWPGNIRELENVIERSFVMLQEGLIGIGALPDELTAHVWSSPGSSDIKSAHDLLDAKAIQSALERNGFNRLAAAKELGIHKTTLFRRIRKLGIKLPKMDGRHGVPRVE